MLAGNLGELNADRWAEFVSEDVEFDTMKTMDYTHHLYVHKDDALLSPDWFVNWTSDSGYISPKEIPHFSKCFVLITKPFVISLPLRFADATFESLSTRDSASSVLLLWINLDGAILHCRNCLARPLQRHFLLP